MYAIALVWLTLSAPVLVGDGRYETLEDCNSFIEFIGAEAIEEKTEEGTYIITEGEHKFAASCFKLEK